MPREQNIARIGTDSTGKGKLDDAGFPRCRSPSARRSPQRRSCGENSVSDFRGYPRCARLRCCGTSPSKPCEWALRHAHAATRACTALRQLLHDAWSRRRDHPCVARNVGGLDGERESPVRWAGAPWMITRHSKQMAVWDFGRMRCDPHHGSTVGVSSGGAPAVHILGDAHAAAPRRSALCATVEQCLPDRGLAAGSCDDPADARVSHAREARVHLTRFPRARIVAPAPT